MEIAGAIGVAPVLNMEVNVRRVIPLIGVCLLFAAAAQSAFAQQRLFVRMRSEVVELDPRTASLGTVIRRFPLPGDIYVSDRSKDVAPFGGGEFLAWVDYSIPGGAAVILLNTRTGAVQPFTFPGFNPARVIGTDGNSRLLVLGRNESGGDVLLVADARSGSLRFLEVGRLTPWSPQIAYAPGGDVLFVARPRTLSADSYHDVDVIRASTGELLKTLDIWPLSASALSTNAAGTRLYVGGAAFDVVTGAQFASGGSGVLDESRNRLISHIVIPPGATPEQRALRGIHAFSADSLQFLGRAYLPELPLPAPTSRTSPALTEEIDFSGLSATLFVLQAVVVSHKNQGGTCHESQLMALDVDTGRLRQTVDTTAALGAEACGADLVRVTEPAPPRALTAEIAGHQVTLTWQAPFGATQYEVEAGSAPGLANIATVAVTDPQLVVDGVPPGVYHLRVRAINTIGKSEASQEVQVVVP